MQAVEVGGVVVALGSSSKRSECLSMYGTVWEVLPTNTIEASAPRFRRRGRTTCSPCSSSMSTSALSVRFFLPANSSKATTSQ